MLQAKTEKESEFVDVSYGYISKKGAFFLCIKDVVMEGSGEIAYTKGKVYLSESDGNITDDKNDNNHRAPSEFISEYFKVRKYINSKTIKNKENEQNL